MALHKKLYTYSPKAHKGKFKNIDNVITETDAIGHQWVRFTPAPAYLTPQLVDTLCTQYTNAIEADRVDPLILTACFIFDFVSIHPFSDGNGRMSRLLTLLLLYRNGYFVGKYISLEQLIEGSKQTYYESLQASSTNWLDNGQDYRPFVRYLLGIILRAYTDFSQRIAIVSETELTPAERILNTLTAALTPLSRKALEQALPDLSQRTIERGLASLQATHRVQKVGRGRSTKYHT